MYVVLPSNYKVYQYMLLLEYVETEELNNYLDRIDKFSKNMSTYYYSRSNQLFLKRQMESIH